MQQALTLANRGKLSVSPNPMVGCIIVKEGLIIAEGWHINAGEPHAEIHALAQAGVQAKDSTVYVTLEPCCHHGRTPPCTDALIRAKVKKVIIATLDPNLKVAGKGVQRLKEAGIEVKMGVLEKQAQHLNKIFFHYQKTQQPFVYAKWAMSLDGRIAVNGDDSKTISASEAFKATHRLRNICDAILVGKQTLIDDNPSLNVRINLNDIKHPTKFILCGELNHIDNNWKILNQQQAKTIFVCTKISKNAADELNKFGIEYWALSSNQDKVSLNELLERMGSMGITSLLVEGGKRTLDNFMNQKAVNEFDTYISSVVIADHNPKEHLFFNKVSMMGKDINVNAKFKENINV